MARTLGVLVAGGRGTRLELGVPKALVACGGETLLARALRVLEALCDDVVVSAPATLDLPLERARRTDDPPGAEGPLAGLVAGLSSRACTRALVLGVDFPLVRAEALRAIGERLVDGVSVALPAPGGRVQPLAAWWSAAALPPLAGALARGERALVPQALALPHAIVDSVALAALPGGEEGFHNVNTRDDLAAAEAALARLALERRA
ncbi:MAG: NTP transferase domain-containing protein [Candidatus Eisenbacteria bacterium]